jgi:hypothetical protein
MLVLGAAGALEAFGSSALSLPRPKSPPKRPPPDFSSLAALGVAG